MAWAAPGEKHQSKLEKMKRNVEIAWVWFRLNYERYDEFRKFFYKTSMTDQDIAMCKALQKPQLEVNIGIVNVARLMGEFTTQEPSIEVRPAYDKPVEPQTIELVDGYMRHVLTDSHKNNFAYNVMEDCYSGAFSVMKMRTDYVNERSFNQNLILERVYEPTLCGFDPMARKGTKADGEYCFENFPMTKELFKKKYKDVPLDNVSFIGQQSGFSWSYKSEQNDVMIVCDYYMKKKRKFKIVELTPVDPAKPGQIMKKSEYLDGLKEWEASGKIEQPPAIVKERMTEETYIVRYRFMEDTVLEVEETDFKDFPLIFVNGNSKLLRDSTGGAFSQFCIPYLYHCRDLQRLLNFSVQTLANYLENMIMHKFKVAIESLPQEEDWLQAYNNVQQASTLMYKAFLDNNPDAAVPPPQEIQNFPAPPEVMATIQMCTTLMQSILGQFDAAVGANDRRMSNDSLVTSITQSNASAQPYIVGYLEALDHSAQMMLHLIPRYIINPRSLPLKTKEGKYEHADVNGKGQPSMKYEDNSLNVSVKAGVAFGVQQQQALASIEGLAKSNEIIGNFIATKGMKFLFDNMDFRGKEQLIEAAEQFEKEMEQQKQQAQAQQSQMPNPETMKYQTEMLKIQNDAKEMQDKLKIHADQIEQDKRDNQVEILNIQKELAIAHEKLNSQAVHQHAERLVKIHDQHHKHKKERAEVMIKHKIASKPAPNAGRAARPSASKSKPRK